ncbi:MAG: hypothetical protein GH151_05040 [Bacteroidetes bacterium]|nr:hypothetical protein [Bacteroidota bacterium]
MSKPGRVCEGMEVKISVAVVVAERAWSMEHGAWSKEQRTGGGEQRKG